MDNLVLERRKLRTLCLLLSAQLGRNEPTISTDACNEHPAAPELAEKCVIPKERVFEHFSFVYLVKGRYFDHLKLSELFFSSLGSPALPAAWWEQPGGRGATPPWHFDTRVQGLGRQKHPNKKLQGCLQSCWEYLAPPGVQNFF